MATISDCAKSNYAAGVCSRALRSMSMSKQRGQSQSIHPRDDFPKVSQIQATTTHAVHENTTEY